MNPTDEFKQALAKDLQQYVGKPMTYRRRAALLRTVRRHVDAAAAEDRPVTYLCKFNTDLDDLANGVISGEITVHLGWKP